MEPASTKTAAAAGHLAEGGEAGPLQRLGAGLPLLLRPHEGEVLRAARPAGAEVGGLVDEADGGVEVAGAVGRGAHLGRGEEDAGGGHGSPLTCPPADSRSGGFRREARRTRVGGRHEPLLHDPRGVQAARRLAAHRGELDRRAPPALPPHARRPPPHRPGGAGRLHGAPRDAAPARARRRGPGPAQGPGPGRDGAATRGADPPDRAARLGGGVGLPRLLRRRRAGPLPAAPGGAPAEPGRRRRDPGGAAADREAGRTPVLAVGPAPWRGALEHAGAEPVLTFPAPSEQLAEALERLAPGVPERSPAPARTKAPRAPRATRAPATAAKGRAAAGSAGAGRARPSPRHGPPEQAGGEVGCAGGSAGRRVEPGRAAARIPR